jgi:hypothetical protein
MLIMQEIMDQFEEVWFHPENTVMMRWNKPYAGKANFISDGDVYRK